MVKKRNSTSESNGRCEFEHLDYCCPPKYITDAGFKCSKELPIEKGDIGGKCGASDSDLMTEEEWEAEQSIDRMRTAIDTWAQRGYRRK
jgi:hypothetical protein